MFATYPIAATGENWINSTLISLLVGALEALQRNAEPLQFYDGVPPEYRVEFSRGVEFPSLYDGFIDECRDLTLQQLDQILVTINGQNDFPGVFAMNVPAPSIANDLPRVHEAALKLFRYAFKKLSHFKTPGNADTIRGHYQKLVHRHLRGGNCPFCEYEILEAPDPDLVDPDLDHYLAISKYPFAGVNLRNLTSMGITCNRSYKGAKDVLTDENNRKAICIDPYGTDRITFTLAGTVLLPGQGQGPSWNLTFEPDEASANWRRVFNLEARFKSTLLETRYQLWLEEFVSFASEQKLDVSARRGAIEAIQQFVKTCRFDSLPTISKLKVGFFDLVKAGLRDPERGDRVHNFVMSVRDA